MMSRRGKRVGTLGDQARYRHLVRLFCLRCGHAAEHEASDLVKRYGRHMRMQAFLERVRCQRCAAKWPEVDLQIAAAGPLYAPPATGRPPGREREK